MYLLELLNLARLVVQFFLLFFQLHLQLVFLTLYAQHLYTQTD
jgi:hypothetical protein